MKHFIFSSLFILSCSEGKNQDYQRTLVQSEDFVVPVSSNEGAIFAEEITLEPRKAKLLFLNGTMPQRLMKIEVQNVSTNGVLDDVRWKKELSNPTGERGFFIVNQSSEKKTINLSLTPRDGRGFIPTPNFQTTRKMDLLGRYKEVDKIFFYNEISTSTGTIAPVGSSCDGSAGYGYIVKTYMGINQLGEEVQVGNICAN